MYVQYTDLKTVCRSPVKSTLLFFGKLVKTCEVDCSLALNTIKQFIDHVKKWLLKEFFRRVKTTNTQHFPPPVFCHGLKKLLPFPVLLKTVFSERFLNLTHHKKNLSFYFSMAVTFYASEKQNNFSGDDSILQTSETFRVFERISQSLFMHKYH